MGKMMGMARIAGLKAWIVAALCFAAPTMAQDTSPAPEDGLLVVYGLNAPTREGDIDHRETIFFSVPKDMRDRVYVRIFDPEMGGAHDFRYGRYGGTATLYRVYGGEEAFSGVSLPEPVASGAVPRKMPRAEVLAVGPGKVLHEKRFEADTATDGTWVSLGAVRARQGEVIGDRAWFRLEVIGADGDDGNGFNVDISLARDRHKRSDEIAVVAYQPTIRWPGGATGTRVEFMGPGNGPLTIQNFDGAAADLRLNQMYSDIRLRASGQNTWASEDVQTDEELLAITLKGGFETPNDVTLSIFDAEGQALPILMPPRRAPEPERSPALPRARELADCASVAFDGSFEDASPLLAYRWDFGDGGTSDEPVIVYSYGEPGKPEVRLRVLEPGTRAARGNEAFVPVHVRVAPRAIAGPDVVVAPGDLVPFDASGSVPSDLPISRYLWTFGDGETTTSATLQKAYTNPGSYRALLRVMDDSNHPCNFGVASRMVQVNFPPVAEAGTDLTTIVGQEIRLNGAASYDVDGAIKSYAWDMKDGTTLTGADIRHAYQEPGVYTVALAVTDDSGVSNATATDTVTIRVNAPPVPVATGPSEQIAVGEAVQLDGSQSTDADGAIITYLWDFGDGAMGEGPTVEYAWAAPGVYDITLTVIDNSGTASASQSTTIPVIVNTRPVARAGEDQFVTTSEVQFNGARSSDVDGKIIAYMWEFGDGRTGQGATPVHSYQRPGVYEVALTVKDDSGAPQSTHRDTMVVTVNAAPIADAGPAMVVAPGEEFMLDGGASVDPDGKIARYEWRFDDGSSKTGKRLPMAFDTPGIHRVLLTVSDDFRGGAASDEAEVLIEVNAAPTAIAGADRLVAPDQTIRFNGLRSHDPDGSLATYEWEFDDLSQMLEGAVIERAWPTPGIYNARLMVRDDSAVANSTSVDTVTIRVNHAPVAEAGPAIDTDRLQVRLDASASSDADGDALIYRWDFGDGSPQVQGREVVHVFPTAGSFPVTLWVDDGTGLANAGAVDATTVTINTRPVADAGGNREVCSGQSILFDASGSTDADGDLLLYTWDFGDGSESDIINPTKTYEMPGTYPVTLKVMDESGSERGEDLDRVAVIVQEGPIAQAGEDMTVCVNQSVRLDGTASTDADGSVNAYEWTFGDGSRTGGATPTKTFTRVGTQVVTLTITGDALGQCSPIDIDSMNVTVLPAKSQSIDAVRRAPVGEPVSFTAVLGDEPGTGNPTGFSWTFSDGGTATGQSVDYTFVEPGVYFATLVTTLEGGQKDCGNLETRHKITVNAAPEPLIAAPKKVAVGTLVAFDGAESIDLDGVITGFAWDFGDGNTATGVAPGHRYEKPGTYTVTLAVTDDAGIANSLVTREHEITVNPVPLAGLSNPAPYCPATPKQWQANVAAGTSVKWQFGDGQSAEGPNVLHSFAKPGLYPVSVMTDDGQGLANSRHREEVYARVNAVPHADAGPDQTVCPGQEVSFQANASDSDGDVTNVRWVFSDGVTLEGEKVSRSFDSAGLVEAVLQVTDDSGSECAVGQDVAMVLVNAPPVVDAGPDRETPVGAAHDVLRFDASGAADPDGQGVRIGWDFGDQTNTSGAVARHRFTSPGTYTVTVTAKDSTGLTCGVATDTATVTATSRDG